MEILIYLISFALWLMFMGASISLSDRYGRSCGLWLIVSILFTPILSIILLFIHGETNKHRQERIKEEEMWRKEAH